MTEGEGVMALGGGWRHHSYESSVTERNGKMEDEREQRKVRIPIG